MSSPTLFFDVCSCFAYIEINTFYTKSFVVSHFSVTKIYLKFNCTRYIIQKYMFLYKFQKLLERIEHEDICIKKKITLQLL